MAPQIPVDSILATFIFLAETPFVAILLVVALVTIGLAIYYFTGG